MLRKPFKRLVNRSYQKTGINGYVCYFSVDYVAITVDDILDIHNYLMEKDGIV